MKKGFTLIETIIYTAVFASVSFLIFGSILTTYNVFREIRISRNINRAAETSLERIIREIRLAKSIDDGTSIFNTNAGRLKLDTVEFLMNGSSLMIKEGASDPVSLNSTGTGVSSLIFRKITASTTSQAIKIEMEISGEKFYSTAILRGSY